jgi:sulfotransferase family protein
MPERTKVIYLMGAGHSGSTILGVTLGNCERCFYAGEVEEWLVRAGQPQWGASDRQRFWGEVTEQVDGRGLFGTVVNRYVERSSAALRPERWPARARMLKRYRRVCAELFGAIARTADARYVVDSSHFPLRARELEKAKGIELYLIFLVRDPQSVIDSNTRELSEHEVAERRWRALEMNANMWLTQLLSILVFLRHPRERRIFLRYEDLVADPEGVLRQLLDTVGSNAAIPDLQALGIGAPLQGNRLIRTDTIALRRSVPASPRWSLLTTLTQRPWLALLARLRPVATAHRRA